MNRYLFWLTDEQWANIEPLLPSDVRGKPRVDDRRVISGIFHVLKIGCRWCDCPAEYGPHTRSTIGSFAGPNAAYGKGCSRNCRAGAGQPRHN